MSYDIRIKRQDGKTVELRHAHTIIGGTYALGGTSEAWLNITYNYWRIFKELLGANGIRTIYGMNINDARPLLMEAAERLGNVEPDKDYWKACDGNAKRAILNLVKLTDMALADYPNDEMFLGWRLNN